MSRKTKRTRTLRKHKRSKMGGGMFDFLGTSTTTGTSDSGSGDWFNMDTYTKGASDFWNKTKKAASEGYTSISETVAPSSAPAAAPTPAPTYVPPPAYTQQPELPSQPQFMTPFGGKKMRKSRRHHRRAHMRGGNYTANTPTSGIAFNAAPFTGYTAQPQVWVGGKTKKRRAYKKNRSNKRRR